MIQLSDICKPETMFRFHGETFDAWKLRMISEYTSKFKELCLFNDSMGYLQKPLHEVLAKTNSTIDDFCEGYVTICFKAMQEDDFWKTPYSDKNDR